MDNHRIEMRERQRWNPLIRALLLATMQACSLGSIAQQVPVTPGAPMIPGIGSEWIYRTQYLKSGSIGEPQAVRVSAIEHGVPVFSIQLGNYKGRLYQEGEAVVGVAAECKHRRDSRAIEHPNVCGWGPCAIRVGESIARDFYAITPLNRCLPVKGQVRHVGRELVEMDVLGVKLAAVRAEANLAIPGIGKTAWWSFIAPGRGEVHAEAPGRRAKYSKVAVNLVPYAAAPSTTSAGAGERGPLPEAAGDREHTQPPARRHPAQLLIVTLGDSLTRGLGVAADQSYPSALQRQLPNVEVLNFGLAGDTVADTHARIEELRAFKADLLLLNIGANDMYRGVPRAELTATLRSLVMCLKPIARRLILLGLEVNRENTYHGVFLQVARDTGVDLIPNILSGVYGVPDMLGEDHMHPNAQGYARIAENVLHGIQAIWLENYVDARLRRSYGQPATPVIAGM